MRTGHLLSVLAGALATFVACEHHDPVAVNANRIVNGTRDFTRAVVAIQKPDGGLCSGTFIGRDLVLTASHCLSDPDAASYLVWDTDEVGTGWAECNSAPEAVPPCHYNGSNVYLPQAGQPPYDVGLLQIKGENLFSGVPLDVASTLPTPATIGDLEFKDRQVTIIGFSPIENPNSYKLQGTAEITGDHVQYPGTGYFNPSFRLRPTQLDQYMMPGDCGGPVILDGKIIGVLVAYDGEHNSYAAYLLPSLWQTIDQDGDGVSDGADNCPAVANASQANCDRAEEAVAQDYKGDACDPDPCLYLRGTSPINKSAGLGHFQKNAKVRLAYRGVGFQESPPTSYLHKNVDGYYCACHDMNSPDPKDPILIDPVVCKNSYCRDNGDLSTSDTDTDTGWLRVAWTHYADSVEPPYDELETSCPLVDQDQFDPNDPVVNDCTTPLQSRLFRKPYADAPSLGKGTTDWEQYWKSSHRTRDFEWDWRLQDYPHPSTYNYKPYTDGAVVRLWIRPEAHASVLLHPILNQYSDVVSLRSYVKGGPDFEELLRPLYIENLFPVSPLGPVDPFNLLAPQGYLVLHALCPERNSPEVEPYRWQNLPPDAATVGVVVKRYDPTAAEFTTMMRSQMVAGTPLFTQDFAATQWGENGAIYAFGGRTQIGEYPSLLWQATPEFVGSEMIYQWQELASETMPTGRADAIFVADVNMNRLLLFFGRDSSGTREEVLALDPETSLWSSVQWDVPGLLPVDSAGYISDGTKLYLYGGRFGEMAREGLYEIDLPTLRGRRIDEPQSGPGPRVSPGLAYVKDAGLIYLFGGLDGGPQADLWRFDLKRGVWEALQGPGSLPQAMERAGVVVSEVDGSVSVLGGRAAGGCSQPVWRWRAMRWQSYADLMDPER